MGTWDTALSLAPSLKGRGQLLRPLARLGLARPGRPRLGPHGASCSVRSGDQPAAAMGRPPDSPEAPCPQAHSLS